MSGLIDWIMGDLSTSGRIWSSLSPAIFLASYFIFGLAVYSIRSAFRGQHRDQDVESRSSSFLMGIWIRLYFIWVTKPLWFVLRKSKIPASSVTTLSLLVAIGAGVSIAAGRFALGGWLYLFSGMLDIFDGRLARAQGTQNPSGAALDSVMDRYSDGVVLIGFAWFYRTSWVLLAVLVAMLGTMLVSYVRARGEGLGVEMKVGIMQRAERILYLGAAAAFSPILEAILVPNDPYPIHRLAVIGLVLLAVSTQLTALRRFMYLLTALGHNPLGGWLNTGRGSLLRNQVAAGVATLADFLLVIALVTGAGVYPWFATIVGCGLGAVVNFSVNRVWAFKNVDPLLPQVSRYTFVS
ncbi:MAG: GtrA family protein, partial [Deltaproteobacteria bacterium]|nr:GtrA family protein [Deltaproteobacteria bacterium]